MQSIWSWVHALGTLGTMTVSALPSREQMLGGLRENAESEVLIIGGGINGLSTLRELAHAGVSVALVERNDFGSGASAGSSHMIHGGIRYLENGEIRLVKESLQERNRLLDNAAHYVSPLGTTIPIFSTFSGLLSAPLRLLTHRAFSTRERGALLIKVGLILYDMFGRKKGTLPRHRFWGRKKSLAHYPGMNPGVRYTAHYSDACVKAPERLALDVLREALGASAQVHAAHYVEAIGVTDDGVVLRDTDTGQQWHHRAQVIVNASGPWTDQTNAGLGKPSSYMGGTKGSHIVLDHPELHDACQGQEVFFENDDGRIVLIFPLLGKVLVGTTDIPIDNPDEAVCTDEEVDYFFDLVGHVFPDISLDRSQIVYRYSGVRPLPAAGDVNPGVVSRDYRIVHDTLGGGQKVVSLVGGKWTTFRALGEHLAQETLNVIAQSSTYSSVDDPIGGGRGFPRTPDTRGQWVESHRGDLPANRADTLLSRYGTIAAVVLEWLNTHGDTPLVSLPDYSRQEIEWIIDHEAVWALQDLTHRRTSIAFAGSLPPDALNELATILAKRRGWSQAVVAKQIQAATMGLSV